MELSDYLGDIFSIFDNLLEIHDSLKPRIIKRVYRLKGKKYYRKILIYNPLYDLLPIRINYFYLRILRKIID